MARVFDSVFRVLILRVDDFYSSVPEERIPALLRVRQVNTWMSDLVFRNIYIVTLTWKVNFREMDW